MSAVNRAGGLGALGALLLACLLGAAIVKVDAIPASTYAFTIGLIGFATLGPLLIWRFARRGDAFALLPCLTGFFLLEFAAGGVFYRHPRTDSVLLDLNRVYDAQSMSVALLIAFGAWLLIVAGYYATPALKRGKKPKVNGNVLLVAGCLWTVGVLARVVMYQRGWYFHIGDVQASQSAARNLVVIVASLPLVATAMVGYRYYRGAASRALYWEMITVEVVWAVPSGERSRLIALGLLLLVVRYYSPMPVRRGPVVAGVLVAVLVVFPFGAAYREGDGTTTGYQADPVTGVATAASALSASYLAEPVDAAAGGADQALRRFAGITSLAVMVKEGPDRYPVEPDYAVRAYASAFVPRALMPGKADPSRIANDFGVEYGIIRRGNPSAVAMTQIGDVWGTFGWIGLGVGMLLVGAFVKLADSYFADRRTNVVSIAVYAALLGGFLVGFETSVAVGLLQTCKEGVVFLLAIGAATTVLLALPSPRQAGGVNGASS